MMRAIGFCGSLLLLLVSANAQDRKIREVKDIPYYEGRDADQRKHKLDLYLPNTDKPFPVVMFIHGGAWRTGDRAMYGALGNRFAEQGIGLAAISYRLSPKVKHPEHVKDCARAFAWLVANIGKHGGDPKRLFVMGHSAGGHLTALLTLDKKYLAEHKVPEDAIKGSIPISGVYDIPAVEKENRLLKIFYDAFGPDSDVCRDASPVTHVKNLKAPMLVVTETKDNSMVRPTMKKFKEAFEKEGIKGVEFADAEDRDHGSILSKMSLDRDDPVRAKIVEFIKKRCAELGK